MAPGRPSPVTWHALLAPLPPGARPRRRPVATTADLDPSAAAAVAGWSSLVLDLSAGAGGLRVVQVLLDAEGRPLSASDHVLFRSAGGEESGRPWIRQENIGGRYETDGTFRGTCWLTEGPEPADDEPPRWNARPRPPTAEEITGLAALVGEMRRRGDADPESRG
jgi:hypothetical protein